jgi:hypothetical protein
VCFLCLDGKMDTLRREYVSLLPLGSLRIERTHRGTHDPAQIAEAQKLARGWKPKAETIISLRLRLVPQLRQFQNVAAMRQVPSFGDRVTKRRRSEQRGLDGYTGDFAAV